MRNKNITKMVSMGILVLLVLTIFLSSYAYADARDDRRAAFAAYVAFGKLKNERAFYNQQELFIVRDRFEFEKAVAKVQDRLQPNPNFYTATVFRDPWTFKEVSGFDIYHYMEKKAVELEKDYPGVLAWYHAKFADKKGKITLTVSLQKDGQEIPADDNNFPLVTVKRVRDDFIVESLQQKSGEFKLDREKYVITFGTLPGYNIVQQTCEVDADRDAQEAFSCAGNYRKGAVRGQIVATQVDDTHVKVKIPVDLEGTLDDLSTVGTYTIESNEATPTTITVSNPTPNQIDLNTKEVTLTTAILSADKTYRLNLTKSSVVVSTLNIISKVTTKKVTDRDTKIDEVYKIKELKDVDISPPENGKITVPVNEKVEFNVTFNSLNIITDEKSIKNSTTNKSEKIKIYDIMNDKDKLKSYIEKKGGRFRDDDSYFVWRWLVFDSDNIKIIDSNNPYSIELTPEKTGTYIVSLLIDHNIDPTLGRDEEKYELLRSKWEVDVISTVGQVSEKEQLIIAQIDEIKRIYELANNAYRKGDKQTALVQINLGESKVIEALNTINRELAVHARKEEYTKVVDNAATPEGLKQQLAALKTKVTTITSKDINDIRALASALTFTPAPGSILGGSASQIVINTPTTFPARTAQADLDALIKKYTIYEQTPEGPRISERRETGLTLAITTSIKKVGLDLFYKDPITSQEISVGDHKEWVFGELQAVKASGEYRIKAPEQVIIGQQAEFMVIDAQGNAINGENFVWQIKTPTVLNPEPSGNNNRYVWTPTQAGEYSVESKFRVNGQQAAPVSQRFNVVNLNNPDALVKAYGDANLKLASSKQVLDRVDEARATLQEINALNLEQHKTRLSEAKAVYEKILTDYTVGTESIYASLGQVKSQVDENNVTATKLIEKIVRLGGKKDVAEGKVLLPLDIKIVGEIAPGKVQNNTEVEFVVVDKVKQVPITDPRITGYTWKLKKGTTNLPIEKTTVNKIKRTFTETNTYHLAVDFEKTDVEVANIADKPFTVIALDQATAATDSEVIQAALATADKKLADATADYAKPDHNLEQDKRLAEEAKKIYSDIKTQATTGASPIIKDADITAKIAAATKLMEDIDRVLAKQKTAQASRIQKIELRSGTGPEPTSKIDTFRPLSPIYITAIASDGTKAVAYKDITWQIINDAGSAVALDSSTAFTTLTLEDINVEGNMVSAAIKNNATHGTQNVIIASVGTIKSEPLTITILGDISKEITLLDGTKVAVKDLTADEATDLKKTEIKYIKFDTPADVWFRYPASLTKEYVTNLYGLTLGRGNVDAEKFQQMLVKNDK